MRYALPVALLASLVVSVACSSDPAATTTPPAEPAPSALPPVTVTGSDAGKDAEPSPPPPDAATPDAGPAADCTREGRAKTAPAALYDALVADLGPLSAEAARRARVAKFLADVRAQGGGPLEAPGSDRVVFLASGAPPAGASAWSVVGSFVSWDKAKALPMTAIAGTDLWVADTKVPRGVAHTYKLLAGTSDAGYREDLLARNVVWDGIDHNTVGEFNGVVHADALPKDRPRMEAFRGTTSAIMGNARDVFVWLPPAYDGPTCKKLPLVVFHDGNESLTRGDFVGPAATLYAAKPELSAILAFVALPNQNVRMDEYTFATAGSKGDDYARAIATEVLPRLTRDFRVCADARARGVSGASLGGLISTHIAFTQPGTFGWVGAQSSSYFWADNAMITRAGQDPKTPARFYLDSGCPNDNCEVTNLMETTLKSKGYDVKRITEANGQHDWAFWNRRMTGMLTHFRDGQTVCD